MPNSFLGSVLEQLVDQNPSWEDMCFVFPSRRAKLFLQREFKQVLKGPHILPEMMSIDDFMASISTTVNATELQQQRTLYESYCATTDSDSPDSFETFLGWSSTLLKDLNTMDQYLLDKESFFSYLSSLHKIRAWGKQEDQVVKNYVGFWQELPLMYEDFMSRLEQKGLSTKGMSYRSAVQLLENYVHHKKTIQFIFCGFNALSPSEEHIILELLAQGRARIFWDIDKQMIDNQFHQAGVFIRDYLKRWQLYKDCSFDQSHNLFQHPKKIRVIEVQQQLGQAKQLGALLAELNSVEDWSKTAIVLADESLLLPLLYALPPCVEQLNISMGYPLNKHPLAVFVSSFLKMVMRKTPKGFYFSDVENMLSLAETQSLLVPDSQKTCAKIISQAKKEHRSYLSADFIAGASSKKPTETMELLFRPDRTSLQWIDDLLILLPCFYNSQQTSPLANVYGVAAEKLVELFHQIKEVLISLDEEGTFTLLRSLYHQLIAGQKLNFVGEPLKGLQILGVLETRTIDFERVLVAGVNEGILPRLGGQPSWVPYDVKKEFGLPTQEDQDAVFTYHFYRLMYRAKEVYLLYNGTTDGLQVGERSRFIRQWAFERPTTHEWTEEIQEATFIPPSYKLKSVPKTTAALKKLAQLAESGFSPSALNLFVKDSYAFYKRYLLGINEDDELEESFSHRTYGTLMHNCLEDLYAPYVAKVLTVADCKQMIDKINVVAKKVVSEVYPHRITGKNILALVALKRSIKNVITKEKEEIEAGNVIEILALEKKAEMTCSFAEVNVPVKIKGTIDRVDCYNGKIRVLDYKTGQVKNLGIMDWSLLAKDPDYGQARQVLIYALLWNYTNSNHHTDHTGIIALKGHQKGVVYVGGKPTIRAKINKDLGAEQMLAANAMLTQIVQDIFDPDQPFNEPPA
ncbi:MAG: PD-(D/E)XK nuclease family protein [Flavobacteriaceae bacterium]